MHSRTVLLLALGLAIVGLGALWFRFAVRPSPGGNGRPVAESRRDPSPLSERTGAAETATTEGAERQPLDDRPEGPSMLEVRVRWADGTPASGASVVVAGNAATTSAEGRARFVREALLERTWSPYFFVHAWDEDAFGTALAPLDAREVTVGLQAAPSATVRGTVVDEETRAPLPGLTVNTGGRQAVTDLRGRFTLPASDDPVNELRVERGTRVIHFELGPLEREPVIEVAAPLHATVTLLAPRPERGTVALYATMAEREVLVEEQELGSQASLAFEEIPVGADRLVARLACPGFAEAQLEITPGVDNPIRLTPVEPFVVRTAPPPPGQRIDVVVARPPSPHLPTQVRVPLSPRGEAVFPGLPAFGKADVSLVATPAFGHGSVRILSSHCDLAERVLDLRSAELHSVRFGASPSTTDGPFVLELQLLDSYGPELPTRWFGLGTSYGAARTSRVLSDARGRLELVLPRCDLLAEAHTTAGSLGRGRRRIDADSEVELRAEERVEVVFHVTSEGLPLPGRRLRVSSAAEGVRETLELVTDVDGHAPVALCRQAYTYTVEGAHRIVEGFRGRIDVAGATRVECPLPTPARLELVPPTGEPAWVLLRLGDERSLYPRSDGSLNDLVYYASGPPNPTTILLEPGAYAVLHGRGPGSTVKEPLLLAPGERQSLEL